MSEALNPTLLPLWGSRLIEASAGTGKTWAIAALYLRLVLGHGNADTGFGRPLVPSQILVMTFTRAATRELSDRIRSRLLEAARCLHGQQEPRADDEWLQQLISEYAPAQARDTAAWRLAMAAEAMDEAAVHTIDAWCQQVLREHAFDSGSLFDEEQLADEKSMLAQAAHDYWRQQIYPLAGEALTAALDIWPDVEALTADVRGLLAHVEPHHGSTLSLGNVWSQAGAKLLNSLSELKNGWPTRLQEMRAWITSQLALKACPFKKQNLKVNLVAKWFDALDAWALSNDLVMPNLKETARHRLTPEGLLEIRKTQDPIQIPPQFDAFKQLIAALDTLAEPADAMRLHAAGHVALRVQELKQRSGSYGFADRLERLDTALAGDGGQRLRARIIEQYPVAMIDEFQDTSALQYRIFDRLYGTAAHDRAVALLLIGDPKQSIYSFRGADIRGYVRARTATAGRHYWLGTNFRSTAPLVAAVNHLFEQAEQRDGQGAFMVRSADANPMPFVAVAARGRKEVFKTSLGQVPAMTLCHDPVLSANTDILRRFSRRCAEHIVALLNDPDAGFEGGAFTALRPADIAVLVRNATEAEAVRRALRQRGVASVYLSDRDSVFASQEATDLLRWLRAVAEPLDSRLVRAAFATATMGLTLDELAALSQDDRAFEQRIELLRQLNTVWHRHGVLPMLRQTLHRLDLPARWLLQPDGERRLTNVLHLAELLQSGSVHLDGEQALIRWLAEQLGSDDASSDAQIVRLESDADLVKVITIHKVKGLEYPLVYLPFGCSFRGAEINKDSFIAVTAESGQRQIDFRKSDESKRAADHQRLQEDLRLLYVALTRARHAIWVGVAALKVGQDESCLFHRSALGYLLAGDHAVSETEIAGLLIQTYAQVPSVVVMQATDLSSPTKIRTNIEALALHEAPDYATHFERNWSIGSFSALVRDLPQISGRPVMTDAAEEEELLASPVETGAAFRSSAPQHRFPRGAFAGNFLHAQLEWLAELGFGLATDIELQQRLRRRCERQGWGHRSDDVLAWLLEVVSTPLPPLGVALDAVPRVLPEMEFWFPGDRIGADRIDTLCRSHLLSARPRPALPDRTLNGMLMGFADLVFEHGGRYWVLDYKSNALGVDDGDYHREALESAMAEHRYDVQAAIYLLALHRLLKLRLGDKYVPSHHLGGAIYFFLRGINGPERGCYVVPAPVPFLDALDRALTCAEYVPP